MPYSNESSTRQKRVFNRKARDRIKAGMIIGRLQKFVQGEVEISPSQVAAAKLLLDRVLPSLKQLDLSQEIESSASMTPQLVVHLGSTEIPRSHFSPDNKEDLAGK